MRLLVDNALSPLLAKELQRFGHDVAHVRDYDLEASDDEVVFERAAQEDRVLVSADTDFATILALRRAVKPSVILFRRRTGRRPEEQAAILQENIAEIEEAARAGSVVVLEDARIRVRSLPIGGP